MFTVEFFGFFAYNIITNTCRNMHSVSKEEEAYYYLSSWEDHYLKMK